jgi:hypothetical protein
MQYSSIDMNNSKNLSQAADRFSVLWRIDPWLGKDLKNKHEYSRYYAIGEYAIGRF